jgi:hypothetical protein
VPTIAEHPSIEFELRFQTKDGPFWRYPWLDRVDPKAAPVHHVLMHQMNNVLIEFADQDNGLVESYMALVQC